MTYLLLICVAETVQLSTEEGAAVGSATESWVAEMERRSIRREGAPLRPVREAATVRVRAGEVLVSDGPFAETKEQIAGYDVVECSGPDEAIEVAAKHPVARFGSIEVRPFQPSGWWAAEDRQGPALGTRYLVIHWFDQAAWPDQADHGAASGSADAQAQRAWDAETDARGVKSGGGGLRPAREARTVRVRDREVLVTDGPFAETKEQVAGLNTLCCASLPEVIEIVSRHPIASIGACELRPFWEPARPAARLPGPSPARANRPNGPSGRL
jgi:hypothetical protein